jgi:hypothetical protein
VHALFFCDKTFEFPALNSGTEPHYGTLAYVFNSGDLFQECLRFLGTCGLSTSVKALAFKIWRDYVTSMIHNAPFASNNTDIALATKTSSVESKQKLFTLKLSSLS